MKTKLIVFGVLVLGITAQVISCKKDKTVPVATSLNLPATPYDYEGVQKDVATLGRVLFYDTHLSVNNAISCGSCHKQALAFSDHAAFSTGFENRLTKRNTPPIENLTASGGFNSNFADLFWDGREKFLPSMVMKPIMNHVEMGMSDPDAIVKKVNSLPYYKDLFFKAFQTNEADADNVALAISGFVSSIVSHDSKFDLFDKTLTPLTGMQEIGRQLFVGKYNCNSCHNMENPRGYDNGGGRDTIFVLPGGTVINTSPFVNIGLDASYADNGRGDITHNTADNGKFKIPNLRNVALTAPYMHDGRFTTLDQVLDHYSHGIAQHPNLDSRLRDANGNARQMNIPQQDREALIAFLNSLSDFQMVTDPKFSNPFKAN